MNRKLKEVNGSTEGTRLKEEIAKTATPGSDHLGRERYMCTSPDERTRAERHMTAEPRNHTRMPEHVLSRFYAVT